MEEGGEVSIVNKKCPVYGSEIIEWDLGSITIDIIENTKGEKLG